MTLIRYFKVLAAHKVNLITARARKNKRTARMLINARKDHLIPLLSLAALKSVKLSSEKGTLW